MRRYLAVMVLVAGAASAAPPVCVVGDGSKPPTATLTATAPTSDSNGVAIPPGTVITYNVYQGSLGAEVKVASGLTAPADTITTGLQPNTTVYWYMTAVDPNGESAPSNEVCKTFPASTAPPGTISVTVK